jgi:Ca2+-binding RTX toxin-like protein
MGINSQLEEFKDAVSLKRDGGRISLEGVLTGAALGIVLLYMLEDALAGTGQAPRGIAPLEDPGDGDLGQFGRSVGRIPINPLAELELDQSDRPPRRMGTAEAPVTPASGGSNNPEFNPSSQRQNLTTLGLSRKLTEPNFYGGANAGSGNNLQEPAENPVTQEENPEEVRVAADKFPELMMVVVHTSASSSSRSLYGKAINSQHARQVGIENSTMDVRKASAPSLELRSDRKLNFWAVSDLNDAEIQLVAEHIGLLKTIFFTGDQTDIHVFGARDAIDIGVLSGKNGFASVDSKTIGIQDSALISESGGNFAGIEGITTLTFTGLGNSKRADLAFNLLTKGMQDSKILMGAGDNTVTVNSGYYVTEDSQATTSGQTGLTFDFGDSLSRLSKDGDWQFSLNARAIGLENSLISTGEGDDRVLVFTRIEDNIDQALGPWRDDPSTEVTYERVGMLNSTIDMGSGNDFLRVNGSIINSIINMGSGENTLIIEGSVLDGSQIFGGDGNSTVEVKAGLGGLLQGGEGNEVFNLSDLSQAGEIDGGGGTDSLVARSDRLGRREVLIVSQPNRGNLDGIRFRNLETISMGSSDDVAIMDFTGSLSGQLLGGPGLDRLEFTNWTLPVTVDLDLGSATAIGNTQNGMVRDFEQVLGGVNNDTLISSGLFNSIDGSAGDDKLYLRWTPWLSNPGEGLQLIGGPGRDLFVVVGLEGTPPTDWNGRSGLPKIRDLDLTSDSDNLIGHTDSIGWLRAETSATGETTRTLQILTPSGLEGIGNAKLLPVAPLESLLAGMQDGTQQLAIAWDSNQLEASLELLGSKGMGTSQTVATLNSNLLKDKIY